MGVQTRVVVFAETEGAARDAARAAFRRIAELDAVLSDYRQDSELNRLCEQPAGRWTPVSEDLFRALHLAREMSEVTDGAFDCTIGPLSSLWREARRTGTLPSPEALAEARARVGWRLVELDEHARAARLLVEDMRLDMGGIGKGLAAQEGLAAITSMGVRRCLVALAGDVAAAEPPPEESAWVVGIETGYADDAAPMVHLRNASVSTSGDTAQYVEIGGVRYSHILDPRSGRALTSPRAATVVARDGATADAFASAACVLGPEETERLASSMPAMAVRIVSGGTERRFGSLSRIVFIEQNADRRTR